MQVLRWLAGGMMIERMPDLDIDHEKADEEWVYAASMLVTLQDAELLDQNLAPRDLLFRLPWGGRHGRW